MFLRLRNEGGIYAWASSEILQYLFQTSTRSSLWQGHAKVMSEVWGLEGPLHRVAICFICRSSLTIQLRWYAPSASVRSLTHDNRTLRTWPYFDASSILLLTGSSWMRRRDYLLSCWQKMHCFQSMWGISLRRMTFWWWACCLNVEELGSLITFSPAFLKRSNFNSIM